MNLSLLSRRTEARWRALRTPSVAAVGCAGVPAQTDPGMRLRRWASGLLALAAAVVVLWIFHGVVRGAMVQGEARRADAAHRDFAAWRCARQGARTARDACTAEIGASPHDRPIASR